MNAVTLPVSTLIKAKDTSVPEPATKSRDEWRKAKELEEARKAGTAPAAVDEEGKDINPHIPQYISSAPWYVGSSGPTLKHQRQPDEQKKHYSDLGERYLRGAERLLPKAATKYRKGACENCGAMTHVKKDCLERPRKVGAKFSNSKIAADELPQPDIEFGFDGKRDRWNGYDPNDYLAVVDEFQKVEDAKRLLKAEKLSKGTGGIELPDNMVLDEDLPEEDEDKYVDDVDMPGTKMDSKERITVRNLRIREDVAKYLRNLDPNSAYYDPKTRSMRDNPNPGKHPEEVDYAGENFVRFSGDTTKHAQAQLFAWEAHEKGVDVHLLAEPTKLEVLQKVFESKKDEFKGSLTKNVLDKYGGKEHLEAPPKSLLLAQTEDYVEYSRQGKIIKGREKPVIRSKYEEDVIPNNHSTIFGSYWRDGNWGYHCCHSLIKNSYCTGDTGRSVNDNIPLPETSGNKEREQESPEKIQTEEEPKSLVQLHRENLEKESSQLTKNQKKNQKRKDQRKTKTTKKQESSSSSSSSESDSSSSSSSSSSSESGSSSSSDSSSDEDEDAKKKKELNKALEKEKRRIAEAESIVDDRKRKYNSRYEVKTLTDAELEAYNMMRERDEDPMLQFMSKKKKN